MARVPAGIDVKVDGFSHKLPALVEFIFRALAALPTSASVESFARVKEALVRQYKNANMDPGRHAGYLRLRFLKSVFWPVEAVLQVR